MTNRYVRVVYGTSKVYLPEGWYSVEELRAYVERSDKANKLMGETELEVAGDE